MLTDSVPERRSKTSYRCSARPDPLAFEVIGLSPFDRKCCSREHSELRTAIDADGVAGDPTRVVRGEERHNRADIIWLADPLERLHAEDGSLALVGLDEIRHVGVDHARRDGVNADAPRPE